MKKIKAYYTNTVKRLLLIVKAMLKDGTCGNRNPVILPDGYQFPKQSPESSFSKLRHRIASEVSRIYYPCCYQDRRLDDLFSSARIIYLDLDPNSRHTPSENGEVIIGDANTFICMPKADLGVLINPTIFPETFLASLNTKGYIIANNYSGTASYLASHKCIRTIGGESIKTGGWIDSSSALEYLSKPDPSDIFREFQDSFYLFQKNE